MASRNDTPSPELLLGASSPPHSNPEQRPVVVHEVRERDTLETLAAQYYGDPRYASYIMAENGLDRRRPLRKGQRLHIPTAWTYHVAAGDTLAELATRYLDDARRAPFLADFNGLGHDAVLAEGMSVTIPFHVIYQGDGKIQLAAVAQAYYGRSARAVLLADYNFKPGQTSLGKGEKIIVPITEVRIRKELLPPPDPQAEARAAKVKEMTARVAQAVPQAEKAAKEASWAEVRDDLVALEVDYLEPKVAGEVCLLLGTAYVALGELAPARAALRKVGEREPGLKVSAEDVSPGVWKLLGEMTRPGAP
jgi:hypothetical protein